jgi:hypothetical protein
MHLFFHDILNVLYSSTIQLLHLNEINIIQLFNGCGCNRLEYFPRGPGNDQKFYCMRPSTKLQKTSYWSSSSVVIVLLHKILENLEILWNVLKFWKILTFFFVYCMGVTKWEGDSNFIHWFCMRVQCII